MIHVGDIITTLEDFKTTGVFHMKEMALSTSFST